MSRIPDILFSIKHFFITARVAQRAGLNKKTLRGRPRTGETIRGLILRFARENPSWGYTRIKGALSNLGHKVARGTVANVLQQEGIDPAPDRGPRSTWKQFLRAHWELLAAGDFFTVEVWTALGLVRYHVFFVIRLATRDVHIAGIVPEPHGSWMQQIARNLTDGFDGVLNSCKYFITTVQRSTLNSSAPCSNPQVFSASVCHLGQRSPQM